MKTVAENIVQKQLDFYNNHDLEGFLSTYHNDTKIYNLGEENTLIMDGKEVMREKYAVRLSTPGLLSVVDKRIVVGNTVIDHEVVTMEGLNEPLKVAAIYEVEDGLIKTVWFVRE
ncbi:MAG: nuclear transport factor 2 family protein [Defluviitaleaceae bacterium]|nr:nuclear transport factor 2 family protein [Defluviitaleaceae bacterium]